MTGPPFPFRYTSERPLGADPVVAAVYSPMKSETIAGVSSAGPGARKDVSFHSRKGKTWTTRS